MLNRYESAKAIYAKYGIDTDKVIDSVLLPIRALDSR